MCVCPDPSTTKKRGRGRSSPGYAKENSHENMWPQQCTSALRSHHINTISIGWFARIIVQLPPDHALGVVRISYIIVQMKRCS